MDYMTLKEASEKWGVTPRRINYYCTADRIPGAVKMGTVWLIPKNSQKPADRQLCEQITRSGETDLKRCAVCGSTFAAGSNRAKYCPDCAAKIRRRQKAESERNRRLRIKTTT